MLTRPQLLNAGVARNTIDQWVKAGRLIQIHRGVYALGHLPPSPHARTMAAVLAWDLSGLLCEVGVTDAALRGRERHP